MKIKSYNAFKYMEVFEVLEWRKGSVYKTRSTGKYVKTDDAQHLPSDFITASISFSLLAQPEIEINLVALSDFPITFKKGVS